MTYLSKDQLARVQRFLPFYLEAQARIGVPWAMLAALHYRESNLGSATERAGGPLQFDPPLTGDQVRRYGAAWKILDLTDPETDVRTALLCAAAFVQAKAASISGQLLKPDSPVALIADVAWSYNGRAFGSWQNSPYVNNDPQNGVQLRITGWVADGPDADHLRDRIDQIDKRPGVLAVMREVLARVALPKPPAPVVSTPTVPPTAGLQLVNAGGQLVAAPHGDFIFNGTYFEFHAGRFVARKPTPAELARARGQTT